MGETPAFELLKEYLANTDYRLIKDGSLYYLRLGEFSDHVDPEFLKSKANQLVLLVNGAANLYLQGFSGVAVLVVVKVREDGVKEGFGSWTLKRRID